MKAPASREVLRAEELDRALCNSVSSEADYPDLLDLVTIARSLETSTSDVVPNPAFKAAARRRLQAHMAASRVPLRQRVGRSARELRGRVAVFAMRLAATIAALSCAGAAAASASASALPGDVLYPLKEATEALAVQTAPNAEARERVLLHQADARLDETARLLEQGRGDDAAATAVRLEQTLARVAPSNASAESLAPQLAVAEDRVSTLLHSAPAPARPGLERALEAIQLRLDRSQPTPVTSEPGSGVAEPTVSRTPARVPTVAALQPPDRDERTGVAGSDESLEHRAAVATQHARVADRHEETDPPVDTPVDAGRVRPSNQVRRASNEESHGSGLPRSDQQESIHQNASRGNDPARVRAPQPQQSSDTRRGRP